MAFIVEAFFSGCISKVINDVKDYSWAKIKSVINDRYDQNISTKICRAIEKSLNTVTDYTYKDSDDLYDAIEKIFIEFQNHGETLESVKCGLKLLGADISDQRCENFLDKFYEGIRLDDDLYKTVMMTLQQNGVKINQEEFRKINEKLDALTEIASSRNDNEIYLQDRKPVKSRTQEYTDKWNENMFLNDFDKRDENVGVNVKLSEVYLDDHLPHYIWSGGKNARDDLKDLLKEYIYPHNDNKMLLILGQPGIGKSTLITWITANFIDRIDDILVYKFASDLGDIDWQSNRVLSYQILEKLGFEHEDLNGKTLILDGLDEVNIYDRHRVLERLYGDWIYGNHSYKFSLIITCRENYVQEINRIKSKYIILQPWDEDQIRSFCDVFEEKTQKNASESTIEKLIENRAILGIPLILYMTLALNITIEKKESIVDIYDKIFSLDGGIYDRCINNKNFADKHRIGAIKEQIHQISRDIAMWMFENNSEEAYIPKEGYQKICDSVVQKQKQISEVLEQDFLIGNFFKLVRHCEGIETEELYFVHRSIYEYFVAETIYSSMIKAINEPVESLASVFGRLFKENRLPVEILQFLKYKIEKSRLKNSFNQVNEAFQLMLKDGMIYHTGECYKNVISCEMNVFANMLELIHLWDGVCCLEMGDSFCRYLIYNKCFSLNLKKINLNSGRDESKNEMLHLTKPVNLKGVNLTGANLRDANFSGADLCRADLEFAKLSKANFSSVNFSGANLVGVDFGGANLEYANFSEADLRDCLFQQFLIASEDDLTYSNEANLKGVNLTGAIIDSLQIIFLEKLCLDVESVRVYVKESRKIMSYQEYCKNK